MARLRQYSDSADRQRAYRERKRNAVSRNVTPSFVTQNVTEYDDDDYMPSLEELADRNASADEITEVLRYYFGEKRAFFIGSNLLRPYFEHPRGGQVISGLQIGLYYDEAEHDKSVKQEREEQAAIALQRTRRRR